MIQLNVTPEGTFLLVEVSQGDANRVGDTRDGWVPYIARIRGFHPTYKYDREWLGRRTRGPQNEQWVVLNTTELRSPVDCLSIRDARGSNVYLYTADPMKLVMATPYQIERWIESQTNGSEIQEVIEAPITTPGNARFRDGALLRDHPTPDPSATPIVRRIRGFEENV